MYAARCVYVVVVGVRRAAVSAGCASAAARRRATTSGNRAANDQRHRAVRRSRLAACSPAGRREGRGRRVGGRRGNNVAPARGRGGAAYGAGAASSDDPAARPAPPPRDGTAGSPDRRFPSPHPVPLRRRVPYRSHESATSVRRRRRRFVRYGGHSPPSVAPPTLGISKTLSPSDSPPIATPLNVSSSKAINVIIYYATSTSCCRLKRPSRTQQVHNSKTIFGWYTYANEYPKIPVLLDIAASPSPCRRWSETRRNRLQRILFSYVFLSSFD